VDYRLCLVDEPMAGECSPGMQRVDDARGNEKQIEETQADSDKQKEDVQFTRDAVEPAHDKSRSITIAGNETGA
jgi:hypothetical protein